jgi:hypothetical protein
MSMVGITSEYPGTYITGDDMPIQSTTVVKQLSVLGAVQSGSTSTGAEVGFNQLWV